MFASVATSGIRVLAYNRFTRRDRFVLAAAMSFGVGDLLVPDIFTHLFDGVSNPNKGLQGLFDSITIIDVDTCRLGWLSSSQIVSEASGTLFIPLGTDYPSFTPISFSVLDSPYPSFFTEGTQYTVMTPSPIVLAPLQDSANMVISIIENNVYQPQRTLVSSSIPDSLK